MTEGASGLYLFSFRAALCGPLWREAGVVVAVNPVAGKGAPFSWRPGLEALWGVSELTGSPPGEVQAAYTWACAACRLALAPVLVEWESEVARRRARAEAELQRYYQRSLEEDVAGLHSVFHQVAVLQVRVTLARRSHTRRQFRRDLTRWEGELVAQLGGKQGRAETLAYELQKRVRELARRYTGTVRVTLEAAARLRLHRPGSGGEGGQVPGETGEACRTAERAAVPR